ncbi:MAG: endolytic transglycosylase MltG [Flavobacteriales bacterium]|nr:endolytic transglycosylase MltG [Flavobacteriales bacterium]
MPHLFRKFIFVFWGGLLIFSSGCWYVQGYRKNLVKNLPDNQLYVYVRTGASWESFCQDLDSADVLTDFPLFKRFAEWKGLNRHLKPGRYKLNPGMTARDIVNLLRSGRQSPVKVSFHAVRSPLELAGRIGRRLEFDSADLARWLQDSLWIQNQLGFTPATLPALFIPNTYELYWNTSAREFLLRMKKEYEAFWTPVRRARADSLRLTPVEVATLASIVQAEQARFKDEWPIIAGLYLNRLHRNIPLESDPTVKYAWNDPGLQRVYFFHLNIDSPYNTYKVAGLPPGPILIPEPEALDAVLQPARHDYIYMCAKEDLSGRHNFAATGAEHQRNAKAYHRALNRNQIR